MPDGRLKSISIRGPKIRLFGSKLVVRDLGKIIEVSRALSSETRLMILLYLNTYGETDITRLAEALGKTIPDISMHVQILAKLGLVNIEIVPGKRGLRHIVKPSVKHIVVYIPHG
jgi:predicted transcriptional regulator